MTQPMASVIIPTCRRPAFLGTALDSVEIAWAAAHIRPDEIEVIVVDDGHDSATRELCEARMARWKVPLGYQCSRKGPLAGPSSCRDQGIRKARGEFIFLLDDDDAFLPSRFKNSIHLLADAGYAVVLEPTLREYVNQPGKPSFTTGPLA